MRSSVGWGGADLYLSGSISWLTERSSRRTELFLIGRFGVEQQWPR